MAANRTPPIRYPLCSGTRYTAQDCREYVIKRDKQYNGKQNSDEDNSAHNNGGAGAADGGSRYKHNSVKGEEDADKGYRLIRAGFYFCEGPHKSDDRFHRVEFASLKPSQSCRVCM